MNQKFTSKERDVETGLDYFGARYFSAAQGGFTTADWSAVPQAVPYMDSKDPQTLNLYGYVRNNPPSKRDPDGHTCAGDDCDNVKVKASVEQKAQMVQNQQVKDINGTVIAKVTGVEGRLVDTVTMNGKPASGVRVTEKNEDSDTRNGSPVSTTLVQGKASTNKDGQIADTDGIYRRTDGTKATNKSIKQDFSNNTWTSTDNQTLTLTFPGGPTCSATSTRTLTNAELMVQVLTTRSPLRSRL